MRRQVDRFREEIEDDLLQSPLVELDLSELWLLKVDAQLPLILGKADNLDDLHDRFIDVRVHVSGYEAPLLNYSQVEEVVRVQHQHLGGDEDRLGRLFHRLVLLQIPDQAHRQRQVALERANHRVMDGHVQRLEQAIRLLLLLEALVCGNVSKVDDLTFLVVEYQRHAGDNERGALCLLA